jgi:hypothetical protein
VRLLPRSRKRRLVTAGIVAASLALFTWQWAAAPRVEIEPEVAAQLRHVRPDALFLGKTFEGLPLRTVEPFLYSDCKPGVPKTSPMPCHWVRVDAGRVTGSNPAQVKRARTKLRTVAEDTR